MNFSKAFLAFTATLLVFVARLPAANASDQNRKNNNNNDQYSNDQDHRSSDDGSDYHGDDDDKSGDHIACGCHECTDEILNRNAGGYTCGDRILFLMEGSPFHLPEKEACIRVSRNEFGDVCGPQCDPGRCDGKKLPGEEMPSSFCGCKQCNHGVWRTETADGFTCGACRIITFFLLFICVPIVFRVRP